MYLVNYIERHLCSGTDSRYQTELVKAPSMDKRNEHLFSVGQGATPWQRSLGYPGAPGVCRKKSFQRLSTKPAACGAVSPNCSVWAQQTLSISGYFNRNMFMHFM